MKLSSLTPEHKTRLLAELDGWSYHNTDYDPEMNWFNKEGARVFVLKHYLTSYDAIIPLVQKLDMGVRIYVMEHTSILDTPSQLSDATLVATGKAEP